MTNIHLRKQNRKHDDEYYTRYVDIENELKNYEPYFKDKIVYCNCDSSSSNFVKYFQNNFERLGLKKLNYSSSDFRSDKSLYTLMHSDIICTNPPFSYIRDFVDVLLKYKKKFLFIGSRHLREYEHYYKFLVNKTYWISKYSKNHKTFIDIDGNKKGVYCYWYTNIGKYQECPFLKTGCLYNALDYPNLDGTDIINVNRTLLIPDDYNNKMAVPFSFIERWNPNQFDILDILFKPYLKGKAIFSRFVIKRTSHS